MTATNETTPGGTRRRIRPKRATLVGLALIAPLALVIVLFLILPLVRFVSLSVDNRETAQWLSHTAAALSDWHGEGLPADDAYAAIARDIRENSDSTSKLAARLNFFEGGMISPDSLPLALGWMIVGLSAIQLVNPFEPLPDEMPDRLGLARALAIIALAAVCAWLIPMTGFLPASMVLAIGACVMMRERRWYVVVIAGVVMPVAIWFAITQLLGRPLP